MGGDAPVAAGAGRCCPSNEGLQTVVRDVERLEFHLQMGFGSGDSRALKETFPWRFWSFCLLSGLLVDDILLDAVLERQNPHNPVTILFNAAILRVSTFGI